MTDPERHNFNSSLVYSAEYDADARTLTVTTQKGGEYTKEDVPPDFWSAFKNAPSAGRFFNQFIKGQSE